MGQEDVSQGNKVIAVGASQDSPGRNACALRQNRGFNAISLETGEDHSMAGISKASGTFQAWDASSILVTKNKAKLACSPQDQMLQRGYSKLLLPPTYSLAHPERWFHNNFLKLFPGPADHTSAVYTYDLEISQGPLRPETSPKPSPTPPAPCSFYRCPDSA